MPHLNPSYNMDFDRPEFAYSALGSLGVPGNSTGMNDISALAAAASDQLYELERHEAFRRAEYELRHRQIAGARKSNGGSPAGTPGNNGLGGTYGFSNERERWGLSGGPTPGGGSVVYPISSAQPATAHHPAVPSGTLADPTYLVPPSCCHEECHKSYRKRLKVAKQTQACPNCLTSSNGLGSHSHGGVGGSGGGGGGSDSHHSSSSNTPKDRSTKNSSDDLTKLGGGGGGASGGNSYALHQNLQQQLARLQQQHHLALQKAHAQQQAQQQAAQHAAQLQSLKQANALAQLKPYTLELHAHRGLLGSAAPSRAASPMSDDSSDDEMGPSTASELPVTSPVLTGIRAMNIKPNRATPAPVSTVTSPIHSRANSRATSPIEGHSANSGKHGHGSHQARDAKHRSHPYTHFSSSTTPNSPHFGSTKNRMSPPKMNRTLSGQGSHAANLKTVEDILNSSGIPPPPLHSDRTLPPPTSSTSFNSTVPSMSYSLSSQPTSAHASPVTSRASSPVHNTHPHSTHAHSHLAHSVRAAFGMTPMGNLGNFGVSPKSAGLSHMHAASPPNRLAPMSAGLSHEKMNLPSFSRGNSPVHLMELDGHA